MLHAIHIDSSLPMAVFLGPTLKVLEAKQILPANYFPPVTHGDLYALLATTIESVVIIDGMFDGSTPVWHREILAWLESGRRVYGASSMGALRAMELHPYGMQGHGQIFEWYRDGIIDGDDEVALLHGVEQLGFVKVSEPLVNLRYSLDLALQDNILDVEQHDSMIASLKSLYFGERTVAAALALLAEIDGPVESLKTYLGSHFVDLKKQDALDLLSALSIEHLDAPAPVEDWFERPSRFGTYMHCTELQLGASQKPDGTLIAHQTLLARLRENENSYRHMVLPEIEYFYLTQLVRSLPPGDIPSTADLLSNWCHSHGFDEDGTWLLSAGLEYDDWVDRVINEYRIEQAIEWHMHQNDGTIQSLAYWLQPIADQPLAGSPESQPHRQATKMAIIARWAFGLGYEASKDKIAEIHTAQVMLAPLGIPGTRIEDAEARRTFGCFAWLLLEGPARFGYQFEPVFAVFKRLQMQGRTLDIA